MSSWGVTLPMEMCPMELSKNARCHWSVKQRAFRYQKQFVWASWLQQQAYMDDTGPWPAAVMDVAWHYSTGRPPDSDNAISRVAACRDAFQDIGLVEDDAHISIGDVRFVKVKRGEEEVIVFLLRGKE